MTVADFPRKIRQAGRWSGQIIAGHALVSSLLLAGLVIRFLAQIAYRPALFYFGDSFGYLASAHDPVPAAHPIGYSLFLRALRPLHQLGAIPAMQHAMGLGGGVLIYVILCRLGLSKRLAALGAAPILLDAYQVNIETYVMAETFTQLLVVVAFAALLWSRIPAPGTVALAGGALGVAAVSRTAAVVLIVPALAHAVLRRFGWVRILAVLVMFAAPLAWHTIWFHSAHDRYALTTYDGLFLYGRVAPFADCAAVEERLRVLCDPRPVGQRRESGWFLWSPDSPLRRHRPPPDANSAAGDFARQVIRRQPLDYVRVTGLELAHYFGPGRWGGPGNIQARTWRFPTTIDHQDAVAKAAREFGDSSMSASVDPGLARFLRLYQRFARTPGMLIALLLMAPVVGARSARGLLWPRNEFLLLSAGGLLLLAAPTMTVEFGNRFFLPPLPLLSAAAAIGADRAVRLRRRRRSSPAQTPIESPVSR